MPLRSLGIVLLLAGIIVGGVADAVAFAGPIREWEIVGISVGVIAFGWGLVLVLGERMRRPATYCMASVTVAAIAMVPVLARGR